MLKDNTLELGTLRLTLTEAMLEADDLAPPVALHLAAAIAALNHQIDDEPSAVD